MKKYLFGIVCIIVVFAGASFAQAAQANFTMIGSPTPLDCPDGATCYYINATGGSDSNNGLSEANAWKKFSGINWSQINPGDYILLKRAEEWREQLTIGATGAIGKPITIKGYGPGADPVINGCDLTSGFVKHSGNVWKKTGVTSQPGFVWFDEEAGTLKADVSALNANKEWHWNSSVLYIYSSSNPNTTYTSPGIEAMRGKWTECMNTNGKSHIVVDGIELRQAFRPINFQKGRNITLKYLSIYETIGSSCFYLMTDSTVEFCRFENLHGTTNFYTHLSDRITVRKNLFANPDFQGETHFQFLSTNDSVFEYNELTGKVSNATYVRVNAVGETSDGNTIRYNHYHHITGASLIQNRADKNGIDGLYIYGNALTTENGGLKLQIHGDNYTNSNIYIVRNTLKGSGNGIHIIGSNTNVTVKNNHIHSEQYAGGSYCAIQVAADSVAGTTTSHNLFNSASYSMIIWGSTHYRESEYKNWQTASGDTSISAADHHGIEHREDPDNVHNPRLAPNSPARDHGVPVSHLDHDFNKAIPVEHLSLQEQETYQKLEINTSTNSISVQEQIINALKNSIRARVSEAVPASDTIGAVHH